ncbi:hypothetical protein Bca101_065274 [Brassica carinata]
MTKSKIEIDRFDGDGDFSLWKRRMYAYLSVSGLKDVLTEKASIPEVKTDGSEEEDPEAKKKRIAMEESRLERCEKAMNMIFLNVGDHVLRKIERCTTAEETWSLLEALYQPKSLPNRVHAQLKLYGFKMQEHRSIDENIDDFLKIVGELSHLSIEVPEEVQAVLLLNALPSKYDQLKETLKYSREVIKVEDVTSSAKSKEKEIKEASGSRSSSEGHFVRGRSETRNWSSSNKGKNGSRSRSKSSEKNKVCWICGKEGHFKKQCYKWLERNKGKFQSQHAPESSMVRDDAQDLVGLIASEVNLSQGKEESEEWVLDTGCSFHMTSRKDIFMNLTEAAGGRVRMANNSITQVEGIGSVRFRNPDGTTFVLHEVRYMPGIARNLISLGTLESKGCEFKGSGGIIKIVLGCTVIMRGERKGNDTLYILQGRAMEFESNSADQSKEDERRLITTKLWHSRLGHVGQKGLEVLAKEGCIDREIITGLDFCEDCIIGKAHRVSFGNAKHVTKEKLDYVHSDLWGSPNVPRSLGNCQYFISFTDDWSRKVWIYFLKTKDEAFEKFVEWKKMVETQSERKVKKLRTDNGLEYCNLRFDKFCKEEGVVRHRTCTYTPQQNGVAERLNRSIMNKVRSMLSESGLEKKFWAEAASTSVYVINRLPSSAIDFKIPEAMWTSALPDLSGLRRFGCVVYVHSDEGKLNPRSKKGIFTGYPDGVKGFRVWLLDEERCVISRNVIFREELMYKDINKTSMPGNSIPLNILSTDETCSFENAGKQVTDAEVQESTVPDTEPDNMESQPALVETDVSTSKGDVSDYQLVRDRVKRQIRQPAKFKDYQVYEGDEEIAGFAYLIIEDAGRSEPRSYQEAMEDPDSDLWTQAADEEMESLRKNGTWVLVDRVKGHKPIGCKWIFKRKAGIAGVEDPRHKGRLVAKGYSQKEGVDFQEIFSPVAKHVSIRFILSMVVHFDMELQQMDVKTAFLHGFLDEDIYMEQPEGYVDKKYPDKVCLLKRSLYGLKQSPRQWNTRFDEFIVKNGYTRSEYDICVYFREFEENEYIYLLLYVDDILIASKSKTQVAGLKQILGSEFEMKDLGEAKKILGMEITRDRAKGTLTISQEGYAMKFLGNYSMDKAKSVSTPFGAHFRLSSATEREIREQGDSMRDVPYQSAVGSIMYSMVGTRPDLAYAVGMVCRFMSNPLKIHWQAVKWILRYIKGSTKMKLSFRKEGPFIIKGYCDADYAADLDKRRSITGMVFTVGGNVVSWRSSLQKTIALSTTEAEWIALGEATREAMWLRGFINELGFEQDLVEIFCDSQSAIALSRNPVHHEKTKHVDVKYNFVRELVSEKIIDVVKIATQYNPADIFTKVLPVGKMREALRFLRVSEN